MEQLDLEGQIAALPPVVLGVPVVVPLGLLHGVAGHKTVHPPAPIETPRANLGKTPLSRSQSPGLGALTINVTRNEILYSLNKPEDFILAIVEFDGDHHQVHYLRTPFQREPDSGVTGVNYNLRELLARAEPPR